MYILPFYQTSSSSQKICTVCEDDPRSRVESVMVFPRKAKKAAQRDETIAVALVEAQGNRNDLICEALFLSHYFAHIKVQRI